MADPRKRRPKTPPAPAPVSSPPADALAGIESGVDPGEPPANLDLTRRMRRLTGSPQFQEPEALDSSGPLIFVRVRP